MNNFKVPLYIFPNHADIGIDFKVPLYIFPNHADIGIHPDNSYLDTLDQPWGTLTWNSSDNKYQGIAQEFHIQFFGLINIVICVSNLSLTIKVKIMGQVKLHSSIYGYVIEKSKCWTNLWPAD